MSEQAKSAPGRVIYLSSFSYPTQHAHPLHALLMARAFSALYHDRFLFVNAGASDASLMNVPQVAPFGSLAPLVRGLGLRALLYPLWLGFFLLTHASWQEDLTVFTNDLLLASRLGTLKGIFAFRVVIDVHGAASARATARAMKYADRIVFVTAGLRDTLTRNSKRLMKKSVVLGNAVDAARFAGGDGDLVRKQLGIPSDAFVLGYAGRFKPMESDKGVSFLLHSLSHIPDVHVLLVGGTKEEVAGAQQEANTLGVAHRTHIVERVAVDALTNYLAACDVLAYVPPAADAFLSAETSPMKLFEYQAAGKPIIVSDLPALRAALVAGAAEAITPGSMDEFIRAVGRVHDAREQYAMKAREAVEAVRENTWEARARSALALDTAPRKSMLRHAFEGMFITTSGDLILKLLSAASTLLILHHLLPYDYGIWRLLLSAMTAVGLLGLTSVSGMFTADIARELGEKRASAANTLLVQITWFFTIAGVIAGCALLIAAPIISHYSKIGLTGYLDLLALALASTGIRQSYQVYFQAYLRPVAAQVFKNVTTLIYLAGIVLWIALLNWGIWGIVTAYTVSIVLPAVFYAPSYFRFLSRVPQDSSRHQYHFRDTLLGRGKWALAEDYVSALTNAAWPWIIGYFLSIAEVGIISLALILLSQVTSVMPVQYVLRSLLPRMASDTERIGDWLVRGIRYSLFGYVVIGIGAFIATTVLVPLFAPRYLSVIPLFGALLFALPFMAVGIVLTEWFYAHKRQWEFLVASAVPSVVVMLLLPELLLVAGLSGFVIWYIANVALTDLLSIWYIRRDPQASFDIQAVLRFDAKDWQMLERLRGIVRQRIA